MLSKKAESVCQDVPAQAERVLLQLYSCERHLSTSALKGSVSTTSMRSAWSRATAAPAMRSRISLPRSFISVTFWGEIDEHRQRLPAPTVEHP